MDIQDSTALTAALVTHSLIVPQGQAVVSLSGFMLRMTNLGRKQLQCDSPSSAGDLPSLQRR